MKRRGFLVGGLASLLSALWPLHKGKALVPKRLVPCLPSHRLNSRELVRVIYFLQHGICDELRGEEPFRFEKLITRENPLMWQWNQCVGDFVACVGAKFSLDGFEIKGNDSLTTTVRIRKSDLEKHAKTCGQKAVRSMRVMVSNSTPAFFPSTPRRCPIPSSSEKQRRMMCSDLGRKRRGQKTRTGMSEKQLRDFCKKDEVHRRKGKN